jgi:aspartyl-tRNA synthetase
MQGALIESFKVYGKNITHADFKSITYQEAIDKYASDKPDLRIQGLEMTNISNIAAKCNFAVFKGVVERGGIVKGMRVEQGQKAYTRNDIDKLVTFCQEQGSKGMAWMKVDETTMEGSITKFFSAEELTAIRTAFKAQTGDYLFFIAGEEEHTNDVLNALRRKVAADLKRVDESKIAFAWITDFRLFKWSSEENKLDFEHSPFTMPNEEATQFIDTKIINVTEDVIKYKKELLALKADCYDLAMNGIEICSGAKRIYRPDLQAKVFEMIAMPKERIEAQFGWFIKAYNYGAPYHRGLAFGVDRIVMLLENKSSIRDVIAFPKNKVGYCPLTHSPSDVDDKQMKELHIKFDIKEEKKN